VNDAQFTDWVLRTRLQFACARPNALAVVTALPEESLPRWWFMVSRCSAGMIALQRERRRRRR
jgi:hypothetical protein